MTPKARGRAASASRAASANWVGATRGTISLGQEGEFKGAEYSEFRNPSVSGSPLEAEDAEKAGPGIKKEHPILQVAVYGGVESGNRIAVSHAKDRRPKKPAPLLPGPLGGARRRRKP